MAGIAEVSVKKGNNLVYTGENKSEISFFYSIQKRVKSRNPLKVLSFSLENVSWEYSSVHNYLKRVSCRIKSPEYLLTGKHMKVGSIRCVLLILPM